MAWSVCKELLLIQMLWNTDHVSRGQMLTECCNGHCSNKTGALLVPLCPETVCFGRGIVTIKLKPLYLTNIVLKWTHFLLETLICDSSLQPNYLFCLMGLLRTAVGICVHIQHCCLWCGTVLLVRFTARVRGSSAVCQTFCPRKEQNLMETHLQSKMKEILSIASLMLITNHLQKASCYFSLLAGPAVITAFHELCEETFGRSYCSRFSFFSAMKHVLSLHSCWDLRV